MNGAKCVTVPAFGARQRIDTETRFDTTTRLKLSPVHGNPMMRSRHDIIDDAGVRGT